MSKSLWLASCIHVGARAFEENKFKRYIKAAQAGKWDVAFLGDLLDFGNCFGTKHISSVWDNVLKPQEQLDRFVELVHPIKNQIVAILRGNHDDRGFNVTGLKVAKIIADELDAPYYANLKILNWNGFNVFMAHGQSSSPFADFDKVLKTYDGLDAIVLGHTHEWMYKAVKKYKSGGKSDLVHLVRAGSFLGYEDYAQKALYQPTPIGSPIIRAHDDGLEIKYGLASI
jgi:predicted phosphodiesterase